MEYPNHQKLKLKSKAERTEKFRTILTQLAIALEKAHKLPRHSLINAEDSAPVLLNPRQTSEFLGLSVKTLANHRSTGLYNLPYSKVGSRIFYERSVLRKYLEERKFNNTSAYHSFPQKVEAK